MRQTSGAERPGWLNTLGGSDKGGGGGRVTVKLAMVQVIRGEISVSVIRV